MPERFARPPIDQHAARRARFDGARAAAAKGLKKTIRQSPVADPDLDVGAFIQELRAIGEGRALAARAGHHFEVIIEQEPDGSARWEARRAGERGTPFASGSSAERAAAASDAKKAVQRRLGLELKAAKIWKKLSAQLRSARQVLDDYAAAGGARARGVDGEPPWLVNAPFEVLALNSLDHSIKGDALLSPTRGPKSLSLFLLEFDSDDFLGLRRRASVRELSWLWILVAAHPGESPFAYDPPTALKRVENLIAKTRRAP